MTGPTVEQIARAIHGAGCCDIADLPREMDAAVRVLALLPYEHCDDEEFCPRCLAGVESSEHVEKCVRPGLAEYGGGAK